MLDIEINKIKPSPTNPRQDLGDLSELVASIITRVEQGKRGLIEPLIVQQLDEDTYQLVIGTRRLEAAKLAGLKTVPCLIEDFDTEDAMIAGLIENDQRKDLEWYERAVVYHKLRGKCLNPEADPYNRRYERSREEIAKLVHKSIRTVEEHLYGFEVFTLSPAVAKLPLASASSIHRFPKSEWKNIVKLAIEKKLTSPQIRELRTKERKILSRIQMLESSHPEVARIIKEFWYPLRFENIYHDMEKEIKIRIGEPDKVVYQFDASGISEEEVKEFARTHMGQIVDKVTKTFYIVSCVPYTIEELRKKWMKG